MCSSYGYKSLPFLHAIIALCELALGILRIIIFFSPKSSSNTSDSSILATNPSVTSPLLLSAQSCAAFALDWIASIVPTLMGIYVILFILVGACSVCVTCLTISDTLVLKKSSRKTCHDCWGLLCFMFLNKANHRCVSLTCNCPWYTARPRLRFKSTGVYGGYMAAICAGSLILLCLTMGLDYYQYRVWWYYRPDGAYKKCRCLCCKQHYHASHQRFLPIPLLGVNRKTDELGNRPCKFTVAGYCPNPSLEHVVIFHAYDYVPQKRYQPGSDLTYIAFHQTTPEAAVSIAKTGFRISDKPPQMLGFGIYFARSFKDTEGKARNTGALICARIHLKRVKRVTFSELNQVKNSKAWWDHYDTVYYAHAQENRDEFCLKDPSQILKWIIIMNDRRLYRYGLDKEFAETMCGCI